MSFVTEIMNPFINVRNQIKNRQGNWVDEQTPPHELKMVERFGIEVNYETELKVFEEWNKKIIIESIVIATDGELSPHLMQSTSSTDEQTNIFRTVGNSLGGGYATPNRINRSNGGHDYFDQPHYNEESLESLMILKRPVFMPDGAMLIMRGHEDYTGNATFKVVWREIDE